MTHVVTWSGRTGFTYRRWGIPTAVPHHPHHASAGQASGDATDFGCHKILLSQKTIFLARVRRAILVNKEVPGGIFDGKELLSWIKFDKDSGKIISNPPKDVNSVDLKIIIQDPDGETIVKDLKIDFSKENTSTSEKILDTDNGFVTLSAQLSKEHANWDNYGSQIIDSL